MGEDPNFGSTPNPESDSDPEAADVDDSLRGWLAGDQLSPDQVESVQRELEASTTLPTLQRELLVHALLADALEAPETTESRVKATLRRAREVIAETPHQGSNLPVTAATAKRSHGDTHNSHPRHSKPAFRRRRTARWIQAATTVAMVSAVVMLGVSWSQSTAAAAMNRVLATLKLPTTRVYSIDVRRSGLLPAGRMLKGTLFTHPADRFVAQFPITAAGPVVLGFDGQQRWWIQADEVWHSDDGVISGRNLVIDALTNLQLQMHRFLGELPSKYQLSLLPAEPLPTDATVTCRPILATRDVADWRLPQTVKLWPDPRSGVVTQMRLQRKRLRFAASMVELRLVEEIETDPNFFSSSYHLDE